MNNTILQLKIKQRLNKLDSGDFDNIECWQMVEAFNKGAVSWCRRQLHGLNIKQTGDEESKRRIDDLQILLKDQPTPVNTKELLVETAAVLPSDYMEWKRVSAQAKSDCCDGSKSLVIYLGEEANLDQLLRDNHKQPNFEWGETFCTLKANRLRIYTNGEFDIVDVVLTYYRQPIRIEVTGCVNPFTQLTSTVDVLSEFKDDIVEVLIDEAVKILAGDIESLNQQQTAGTQVEGNN